MFFLDSQLVVLMQVCLGLSLPSSCVVGVSLAWVLWLSFCASLDLLVVEGLLHPQEGGEKKCWEQSFFKLLTGSGLLSWTVMAF